MTTTEVRDRLLGILPSQRSACSVTTTDYSQGGIPGAVIDFRAAISHHVKIVVYRVDDKGILQDTLFFVNVESQVSLEDAFFNAVDKWRNWEASQS
jgi:hypothetical protein